MSNQNFTLFAQIAAQQRAAAAAAAANPVWYIPASEKDGIRAKVVLKIHAICHPLTETSGTGKTNHWTLSFNVGNGQGVGLDLQPNPQQPYSNGGSRAQVTVSMLDYVVPESAERSDPVSVINQRTVGWYIDYLASGGRFRYAFTSEGIGCRHWMTDTLKHLAEVGEVNSIESDTAGHAIAYTWPDNRADEPAAGTYF